MFRLREQPSAARSADDKSARIGRLSSRLRDTVALAELTDTSPQADFPMEYDARGERRMLWVDGVGGYLVCLANDVVLGQASSPHAENESADIGVQADLSRRHAKISRSEGRYVLSASGPVICAGKPVETEVVLNDGDEFQLGDAVRIRFERPHALSVTAKLVVVSGHRTVPAADGVLLMGESCVVGPQPHSHIRCPKWSREVLLFKGKRDLQCRSGESVLVTDAAGRSEETSGPAAIPPGSRVEAEDLCLSIEEV